MDGMGWNAQPFLLSFSGSCKRAFFSFFFFGSLKTASFLQSARCPFVKQTHPAALCSELAGSEIKRKEFKNERERRWKRRF